MQSTTMLAALARAGDGLEFAVAGPTGAASAGGPVDEAAIARLAAQPGLVAVVGDYGLLASPPLQRLLAAGARIALMPPAAGSTARGATALAHAAAGRPGLLAMIDATIEPRIRPLLAERQRIERHGADLVRRILALVEAVSPRYVAVLAPDGALDARALRILRAHPTPRGIRVEGLHRFRRRFELDDRLTDRVLVDALLRLIDDLDPESSGPDAATAESLATALVPGMVEERLVGIARRDAIDAAVHHAVAPAPLADAVDDAAPEEGRSIEAIVGGLRPAGAHPPAAEGATTSRAELLALARDGIESRYRAGEDTRAGLARYREAREALGDDLDALTAIELDVRGQLLAIDGGDAVAAAAYRGAALRRIESEPAGIDADRIARLRRESDLADVIAGVLTADPAAEFARLRELLGSPEPVDPRILLEASGVHALLLTLWGEHTAARAQLDAIEAVAGEEWTGVVRAPAEAARALALGGPELDEPMRLAIAAALQHGAGTPYEPYAHYAEMLSAYLSKDAGAGLESYHRLRRAVARHPLSLRIQRMVEYSHALMRAGDGDLSGARAVVDALPVASSHPQTEPDRFMRALVLARLDATAGRYDRVLAATDVGGPLAEERALRMQPRYASACLALRGAALAETGDGEGAAAQFRRALAGTAARGEYLALLAAETEPFRRWLEAAALAGLPESVPADHVAAILRRPVFIDRTLPALTRQQERALLLLATGKPVAAIAAELSVSPNTVKTHLRQLYRRLGIASREQATPFAREYGLAG